MFYYIKKFIDFITTLILVSVVTFLTFQLLPGNPALTILGPEAEDAQVAALEQELQLDRPLYQRYIKWVKGVFSGNLGKSYKYGQSVTSIILERVKTTAVLAGLSLIFSLGLGLFLGLFFAISRKNPYLKPLFYIDQIFISIPSFCTALLLILFFTVLLRLLPSIGVSGFSSFILPALSLSLGSSAILARYIKTSVDDEYKKDYVRTARSKGLTETQIIYRHILRNAIIPSITTLGLIATDIFGGSIIVENVFSLPGIGKLIVTSISSRDFPLLQGLTLYLAAITLFCNFAVDILYSVVDPRTRN